MNPHGGQGPTCPKCGRVVLAEDKYRLRHGDVEHISCDEMKPTTPASAEIDIENKK